MRLNLRQPPHCSSCQWSCSSFVFTARPQRSHQITIGRAGSPLFDCGIGMVGHFLSVVLIELTRSHEVAGFIFSQGIESLSFMPLDETRVQPGGGRNRNSCQVVQPSLRDGVMIGRRIRGLKPTATITASLRDTPTNRCELGLAMWWDV